MARKPNFYVITAFVSAIIVAAVLTSEALLGSLSASREAGSSTADGQVQLMAGCDPDPEALDAIASTVQSIAADEASAIAGSDESLRLQSVCQQGDWAYAFATGTRTATYAAQPLGDYSVLIAQLTESGWQVLTPDMGPAYDQALEAAPDTLIPDPAKALLSPPTVTSGLRFSNFALPWPADESAYVIWHWYAALDFSIGTDASVAGAIRNAKAGVAVFVKESSTRECGSPPPDWYCWMAANLVVIQSAPNEFAWYLHLAPNSVPDWIQEGVYVPAGAEIGLEGATGWAVSPHLHFQVASTYSCCDGEGDSRMPHWPINSLGRVDFVEYSWENLPWQATSQNRPASEPTPVAPPPDDPVNVAAPVPQVPTEPPPPPPVVENETSSCPSLYIVQRGEWLLKIAERCGVSVTAIVSANPGLNPNLIYAGQALAMPGGVAATAVPAEPTAAPPALPATEQSCTGTHVVARGESLFRIAYNCGLTTLQLATLNGISPPYTIYPGQTLQFPQP